MSREESASRVMSRLDGSHESASSEVADLNTAGSEDESFAASSEHPFQQHTTKPLIDEQLTKHATRLSTFVRALAGRCRSAAFADITLSVGGVDFPCHRLVLACSSEHFASMFQGDDAESISPPVCIKLSGTTSEAVDAVLRVVYFESTVQEVLAEEPRRLLQVIHLAGEWLLMDVLLACKEFVHNEIKDIGLLEEICIELPFDDKFKLLRETCHDRLQMLREVEEARRRNSDILSSMQAWHDDRTGKQVSGGRWPTGSSAHQWSAPVSCPRGLRW